MVEEFWLLRRCQISEPGRGRKRMMTRLGNATEQRGSFLRLRMEISKCLNFPERNSKPIPVERSREGAIGEVESLVDAEPD